MQIHGPTNHFQSVGCFSYSHFRLRYEPTPTPHLLVTNWNPYSEDPKSHRLTRSSRPRDLGIVELTTPQVARLDNLFRYYRKQDGWGGCTTSDAVFITLYQNGLPVRRERLEDSTCQSGLLADADPRDLAELNNEDAPSLSLDAVIETAAQAKKHGISCVSYRDTPRTETAAYRAVRDRKRDTEEARHARRLVERLAGYSKLRREFRVNEIMLGDINLLPYSLHTTLTAIRPRAVSAVWWFDPVLKDRPQYDWNQFLAVHQQVERVVARHTWIAAWKQAGPGRTAEAHIFGITPTEETDLATQVTPAWGHAGLRGEPRYQILLRRSVNTWAELYFGDDESRALIVMADPARDDEIRGSKHWLDGLEVLYHRTEAVPDYVVVSPDGTWKRNTRAKDDVRI